MTKRAWSATETAAALGISDRHLRRLIGEHVLAPGKAGFDPIPTLQAFIRHLQRDSEAKRARAALAEVEAKRKALQLRRQLGQLVTLDELRDLAGELWSGIWSAWQISAATFYAHVGMVPGVDSRERLRISNICDQTGKAELIALRERWEAKLRGEKLSLQDQDRIDALIGTLSTGADDEGDEH
jgi:hypothetical protein